MLNPLLCIQAVSLTRSWIRDAQHLAVHRVRSGVMAKYNIKDFCVLKYLLNFIKSSKQRVVERL